MISDLCGYSASALVLLTFTTRNMRLLRAIAILSNIAFMIYGAVDWLPPVFILHTLLLPLNIVRLLELLRSTERSHRSFPSGLRNSAFTRKLKSITVLSPATRPRASIEPITRAEASL